MTLDELGRRICIMGPSNSGKSTLAAAISRARGLPPIHLDQLRHLPHTDWQLRSEEAFVALHDTALLGESWVMEGNYTAALPQRLARATGLIVLDVPMVTSLVRYLRRCWFADHRHGGLEGAPDRVKWEMLRFITGPARVNRQRYAALFDASRLAKIRVSGRAEMAQFLRAEGLGAAIAGEAV